jgi:nucleoside 2-deoxyribosyltransferase
MKKLPNDLKVYVSGALMGSVDLSAARTKYEMCAALLREAGCVPFLPHQNTDPEQMPGIKVGDVFARDTAALMTSGAVIAFLDEPSLGVGAELAICVAKNIPVIALVHQDARVSRFISGMLEASPTTVVMRYREILDVREALAIQLEQLVSAAENSGR